LRHLSPEQKRQRKIELQRDWQRLNKKKIPKARKAWLRKFREKFLLQKRLGKTPDNPAECARAFNWTNLQPMFALPNRMKSNKVTNPQQSLPLVIA
jgi:hypothetical protein